MKHKQQPSSDGASDYAYLLHAETRTWTSSDGRKLEAELVSYDLNAETVTIKNNRGEFTLPFAKLVEEDQTFIRTLAEKEAAQREVAAQEAAKRAGKTSRVIGVSRNFG